LIVVAVVAGGAAVVAAAAGVAVVALRFLCFSFCECFFCVILYALPAAQPLA